MPCARLNADNLLGRLAVNVGEAYAAATLRPAHVGDPALIIRVCGIGDEIADPRRVNPILTEIIEMREQAPDVNRRHVAQLVVELAVKAISMTVVVVVPQVFRVGSEE